MADWGGAGKGALGGAATGATIGSAILPGWGTAIGGVVGGIGGGLAGLFGGDDDQQAAAAEQQKRLEEYRQQLLGRKDLQLGQAAQAGTSDFRTSQQGLIDRLDALSKGHGPSLAGEQLKQATDRNMAQQQSIAQSGHGNATLANLVAANNSQNLGQAAAQQAAIARIAETQAATQQLGQVTSQARAQDEQGMQFNAQQQNFQSQAALEARLKLMGLDDTAITSIMAQQSGMIGQQNAMSRQPSMGDQIFAGGVGALGQWAGNRNASRANAMGQNQTVSGLNQGNPLQGTMWDSTPKAGFNYDNWAKMGGQF